MLQIRTVLPPKTVDELLDNVALRRLTRRLAEQATLVDPILATHETAGFEILNDIVNCVAGSLASSPYRRDQWLLAVTCEDRKVVRKCCIRVLLVRRSDIERLASWEWCRGHILVEEWYHYWRIVTLHQIATPLHRGTSSPGARSSPGYQGKPSSPGRSTSSSSQDSDLVARHQHRRADHQAAGPARLGPLSAEHRGAGPEAPRCGE